MSRNRSSALWFAAPRGTDGFRRVLFGDLEFAPEPREGGTIFDGEVEDAVESLAKALVPVLKSEA